MAPRTRAQTLIRHLVDWRPCVQQFDAEHVRFWMAYRDDPGFKLSYLCNALYVSLTQGNGWRVGW